MNAFVELIKKIGIFMIAAQAVIHFAPGQKYEKYIKLIVGIMVLLQFLTPVYRMLSKTSSEGSDWTKLISDALTEDVPEEIAASEFIADTVINQLEEEIKFRLNQELAAENYCIAGVKVSMRTREAQDENGIKQYELERVRVMVRRTYSIYAGNGEDSMTEDGTGTKGTVGTNKIDKVQIQKINVTLDDTETSSGKEETEKDKESASPDRKKEKEREFRERFCSVLGMEEKHMEVSVYGEADESDG